MDKKYFFKDSSLCIVNFVNSIHFEKVHVQFYVIM